MLIAKCKDKNHEILQITVLERHKMYFYNIITVPENKSIELKHRKGFYYLHTVREKN